MKKNYLIFWFGICAAFLFLVPALNIVFFVLDGREYTAGEVSNSSPSFQELYRTDRIESALAHTLYRQAISAAPHQVVAGKEGWLFLGNSHDHIVDKTRGRNEYIEKKVFSAAEDLQANLDWLNAQGILTVFAIVPNKHEIYPEYLPDWMTPAPDPALQLLLENMPSSAAMPFLVRPAMLSNKRDGSYLYEVLDSHWNVSGAYVGYSEIMRALDRQATEEFQSIDPILLEYTKKGGDLVELLKLDRVEYSLQHDSFQFDLDSIAATLCKQALALPGLEPSGDCVDSQNSSTEVGVTPVYTRNSSAANEAKVLWLRDSFGRANSQLFQATFSEVWQVHHRHLVGAELREFVLRERPDILIYQVVERLMDATYLTRRIPH